MMKSNAKIEIILGEIPTKFADLVEIENQLEARNSLTDMEKKFILKFSQSPLHEIISRTSGDFLYFGKGESMDGNKQVNRWKLHVNMRFQDFSHGISLIIKKLLNAIKENVIRSFKVVRPSVMKNCNCENYKNTLLHENSRLLRLVEYSQTTIYLHGSNCNYAIVKEFCNHLEQLLQSTAVPEKKLLMSKDLSFVAEKSLNSFVSYRNDRNAFGTYISAKMASSYSLGVTDPFQITDAPPPLLDPKSSFSLNERSLASFLKNKTSYT